MLCIEPYHLMKSVENKCENKTYGVHYTIHPWCLNTCVKFNIKRSSYIFEVNARCDHYAINIKKNRKWMYNNHKNLINLVDVFRFLYIKTKVDPSIIGEMADDIARLIKEHPNFKSLSMTDTSLATFIQDAGKDHSAMFIRETDDNQSVDEVEETSRNSSNRHVLRLCEIKDSTRNLTTSINGVTKVTVSPKTISLINDVTMVKVPKSDKRVIFKLDVHHSGVPEEEYLFYDFNGVMNRVADLRAHEKCSCETVIICIDDNNIELEYTVFIND